MTGGPYSAAPTAAELLMMNRPQHTVWTGRPQITARKLNAESEGDAAVVDAYDAGGKRGSKTEEEVERDLLHTASAE